MEEKDAEALQPGWVFGGLSSLRTDRM